jgi:protein required for attachment to host cells
MNNHSHTTWIVVAHRGGAVVYESRGPGRPLGSVLQLRNPRGRLKSSQMQSDRPGRSFDRRGDGRHALSAQESAPDHIARAFVSELAERLEHARTEDRFDRLVLVAPPKTLGQLRGALSEALRALLIAELPKDLAHSDGDQVRKQLAELALV